MKAILPKYMTFKEMKKLFPDTWILLANPESEPASAEISGGFFVYKNKNKKRLAEIAKYIEIDKSFVTKVFRIIYTGEIKLPKNHIVCL